LKAEYIYEHYGLDCFTSDTAAFYIRLFTC